MGLMVIHYDMSKKKIYNLTKQKQSSVELGKGFDHFFLQREIYKLTTKHKRRCSVSLFMHEV